MGGYSLKPEMKSALRALPWKKRIMVRLLLHRRLKELCYWDERICRFHNTYDCGPDLINQLTKGAYGYACLQGDLAKERVEKITKPILNWYRGEEQA